MWLMEILPHWVFHAMLLAGALGLIASFISYHLTIQVISILLIFVGIWFNGAMSNQGNWEAKVNDLTVELAEANAKSQKTNVKIVSKIVKQIEIVKTRGDDIIKYIDREVVKDREVIKFVENCPIPNIIIKEHNAAALNQPTETNK